MGHSIPRPDDRTPHARCELSRPKSGMHKFGGRRPIQAGGHIELTGGGRTRRSEVYPDELCEAILQGLVNQMSQDQRSGGSFKSCDHVFNEVEIDQDGNVTNSSDFISGWLKSGKVIGRPSAPLVRNNGSLLISDDKANVIYLVTYQN